MVARAQVSETKPRIQASPVTHLPYNLVQITCFLGAADVTVSEHTRYHGTKIHGSELTVKESSSKKKKKGRVGVREEGCLNLFSFCQKRVTYLNFQKKKSPYLYKFPFLVFFLGGGVNCF